MPRSSSPCAAVPARGNRQGHAGASRRPARPARSAPGRTDTIYPPVTFRGQQEPQCLPADPPLPVLQYRRSNRFRRLDRPAATDATRWSAVRRPAARWFGRPFNKTALGALFTEALAAAGCPSGVSSHSLRRAGLSWTFLALHEQRTETALQPRRTPGFLEQLTGWTPSDRQRIAAEIALPQTGVTSGTRLPATPAMPMQRRPFQLM